MNIKTLSFLLVLGFVSACSHNDDKNHFSMVAGSDDTSYLADVQGCPKVHIRQNDHKIVQYEAGKPLFEIQMIGADGYCYYNEKTKKDKAVVRPIFNITRLSDSDVTDIHFSYYIETVEGPARYLGRKTLFETVSTAEEEYGLTVTATGGELIIPEPGTYNLDVYAGLYARKADSESKN